jgi:environmental stress-induced protein Ves
MAATLLPAATRARVPWKNGGGTTQLVAVGGDPAAFGWRISMADVTTPGAFSEFPGVDRIIASLSGTLDLRVAGRPDVRLEPLGAPHAFPGDVPAWGGPLGGAVLDLNLMLRRGVVRGEMRPVAGQADFEIIWATVILATGTAEIIHAGQSHKLGPLDALLLDAPPGGFTLRAAGLAYVITLARAG